MYDNCHHEYNPDDEDDKNDNLHHQYFLITITLYMLINGATTRIASLISLVDAVKETLFQWDFIYEQVSIMYTRVSLVETALVYPCDGHRIYQ